VQENPLVSTDLFDLLSVLPSNLLSTKEEMEVKPCPKACTFDWAAFEILFDIAVCHMIEEKFCYVHKTSIADLMDYVLGKQQANEQRDIEEITYGDDDNDTTTADEFPGGHSFAYCVRRVPAPNNLSTPDKG
jgi:hypothetical protein